MPEGDTLHRIARALQVLVGKRVKSFALPRQAGIGKSIPGTVVDEVVAVGKNLVIGFDNGLCLHTHLKMTGSWHLYQPGARWRRPANVAVAVVDVSDFVAVCFSAPVTRLVERRRIVRELVSLVEVDLLGDDGVFDLDEAVARLRKRNTAPLGEAIMDQQAVAGIGNVYKSEGLFRRALDPFAPVAAYDDDTLKDLLKELRAFMQMNVTKKSGSDAPSGHYAATRVTTGPLPPTTLQPETKAAHAVDVRHGPVAVYGREGMPCRVCGTPIAMKRQGEMLRSTYYCPACQLPRTVSSSIDAG